MTSSISTSRCWRVGYKVFAEWSDHDEEDEEEETTEEEQEVPTPAVTVPTPAATVPPEDNVIRYEVTPGHWVCTRPKSAESIKTEKKFDSKEEEQSIAEEQVSAVINSDGCQD